MPDTSIRLEQALPLIRERLDAGQSVQFTPHGTSMRPMLEGGRDQVVLSPLPTQLKKYDLPLYRRDNGQFVLHRVVKTGQTYTCIGDNQFQPEPGVRPDQLIALVTGFTRKGRTWQVADPAYRAYCRYWHVTRPVRRVWRRCVGLAKGAARRIAQIGKK